MLNVVASLYICDKKYLANEAADVPLSIHSFQGFVGDRLFATSTFRQGAVHVTILAMGLPLKGKDILMGRLGITLVVKKTLASSFHRYLIL
jgi:hypothetical protein